MSKQNFLIIFFMASIFLVGANSGSYFLSKITGGDGLHVADVFLDGGVKKLAVQATTVVEQVFGQDPQGATFFFFGSTLEDANGIGLAGDTVRVEIPAAVLGISTVYPAVDVTTTIQASDISDPRSERAVAERVCSDLNGDANFDTAEWKCEVMKDFGGVFISSRLYNEWGERTDYTITCSGTTSCNKGESDIQRRGRPTELSRSPNDPRQGVLAISGQVFVSSSSINEIIVDSLKDTGGAGSDDMLVNGASTPVKFEYNADQTSTFDTIIQKVSCFCQGNGIQFSNFCSKNNALSNGITFKFVSEGITTTFATIKTTDDWKHIFTLGDPTQFGLDIQSGADDLLATAVFEPPILLEADSADEVSADVNDNILTGLIEMKCRIFGFKRDL